MENYSEKKHILIVEDDRAILDSLVELLLDDEGYEVSTALNGQEALDLLRNATKLPSLVLLDLMMPVMDGIQFREEQERDPRLALIPIVLMSADGQIESKKMRVGLRHHLKKPLDIDNVIETVRRVST